MAFNNARMTIVKEIKHYRDKLNRKIESALYNKSNINDEIITEMIMMSGYLSNLLKKDKTDLKSKRIHFTELITRIKELLEE